MGTLQQHLRGILFALLAVLVSVGVSSAATQTETLVAAVGTTECLDCAQKNLKTEDAVKGLRVAITCMVSSGMYETKAKVELDSNGNFDVKLPSELLRDEGELKHDCFAQLYSMSNSPCPAGKDGLNPSKLILKSKENGKHTFFPASGGKLSFASATCVSDTFWPWHKKSYPKHKIPMFPHKHYYHKHEHPKMPPKPYFHKHEYPKHYSPPTYKPPSHGYYSPPAPVYKKPAPEYKPPSPSGGYYKPPAPVEHKPPSGGYYNPPAAPVYKPSPVPYQEHYHPMPKFPPHDHHEHEHYHPMPKFPPHDHHEHEHYHPMPKFPPHDHHEHPSFPPAKLHRKL